jgi:thiamine biosynthesis protein ThiS
MAPTGDDRASGIRIVVNGEARMLEAGATLDSVVLSLCSSPSGIAVARNREVVPRTAWSSTRLELGDRIEIVTAAAGG